MECNDHDRVAVTLSASPEQRLGTFYLYPSEDLSGIPKVGYMYICIAYAGCVSILIYMFPIRSCGKRCPLSSWTPRANPTPTVTVTIAMVVIWVVAIVIALLMAAR
jgi:hypothetical protein